MSETTENLIKAIAGGNSADAQELFNTAMVERIAEKMNTLRVATAKALFNKTAE
jgi:hypothetical protein